jgi:hypothetical protein
MIFFFICRSLRTSINVECSHAGIGFRRSIKSFLRTKCHAIFLDTKHINSPITAFEVVYMMFLVAALRSQVYLESLQKQFRGKKIIHKNTYFIITSISSAIKYGAKLLILRTKRKRLRFLDIKLKRSVAVAIATEKTFENMHVDRDDSFDACVDIQNGSNFGYCCITQRQVPLFSLIIF